MSGRFQKRRRRRSHQVVTPLLVTAGLLGLPVAFGLSGCAREEKLLVEPTPPVVNAEQSYPNNYFLPGAGYYHAPFHAWYPFPYNHYVGNRGWYRGGSWRSSAQADLPEREDESRAGAFLGRPSTGMTNSFHADASRPSPEAVSRANAAASARARSSVLPRGGFGHSSRPAIS